MSKQTELAQLGDAVTVNGDNVGIGTSSPNAALHVSKNDAIVIIEDANNGTGGTSYRPHIEFHANGTEVGSIGMTDNDDFTIEAENYNSAVIAMKTGGSERMRLDSSGTLLVGKTASDFDGGVFEAGSGGTYVSRSGTPFGVNRNGSEGALANFYNGGTHIGTIKVDSANLSITGEGSTKSGLMFGGNINPLKNGVQADNAIDMGTSSHRFDDIHATNGTIQTSDRNEKQDIEELTEAEQRVAVAAKGLLRKFRWKSAVAKKGDNARTHFGIIAQDLQSAFEAEGLDAGKYAMFISSTWWEHQVEVPAVEADEEKGIEAADAYTRIDTYDTAEEAPEGATQRTRLGVRYSELLAFIIGAL